MDIRVVRSLVGGTLEAPSSKSMTHRALICSALAKGESVIRSPLISDDTLATRWILEFLGAEVSGNDEEWKVKGGSLKEPYAELDCGESGTTIRFMTAVCSLVDGVCKLTGGQSLSRRPMEPLVDGLKQLGVNIDSKGGLPPIIVKGRGRIRGGEAAIRGDISSQFVSALLLVAPLADRNTVIKITTQLESKPYVSMTMDTQRLYGVEVEASEDMTEFKIARQSYVPVDLTVEGDWSSAAFLLAAGALTGDVTLGNLNMDSEQADKAILDILKSMGAIVECRGSSINVREAKLRSVSMDILDCPDLFPVVTSLCTMASGTSTLTGIRRLQFKESDRIAAMAEGLKRMGVRTTLDGDTFTIEGGKPKGSTISPHHDHRIAMAFTVLGLVADGETTITNAECVSKSYPGFWDDMESIGAEIRSLGE
jgi:3-phosphoshikimate 1-carboxyvinyltransferase